MKGGNAHFARIADLYHELNRAIHRMETDVEPVADETLEGLKRQRLTLKGRDRAVSGDRVTLP